MTLIRPTAALAKSAKDPGRDHSVPVGAIISELVGGIIPLQGGGIIPELGGGFLRNQHEDQKPLRHA